MNYLQSDEGKVQMDEGLQIIESSKQIDDLIVTLQQDRHAMNSVFPYLPADLRDELLSDEFASECLGTFATLDTDGSGSLEPTELYDVILQMTNAHEYALDMEQCK